MMNSSIQKLTRLFGRLWRLRPHLRGGRYLVSAVVGSSLLAGGLEGVAVALLVPLLSLLQEGNDSKPMRPITWMREFLPGHGAAFYVVAFCGVVLGALATKNIVLYVSQVLAAKLRQRIAANLRLSLFKRLHGADLQLFEQHTAGELANVFFVETVRTISMVDFLLLAGQRASIGLCYLVMLFLISWPLTLMTIGMGMVIASIIFAFSRGLVRRGKDLVELNQRMAAVVGESFAGIRVVRSTNSQEREIERFSALNSKQAEVELQAARKGALVHPLAETIGVSGGIVMVACAYLVFVRSKVMLSSHLFGFGLVMLRLLPLLNQMYALYGQLSYLAGGVREVERWLDSPQYPLHSFGTRDLVRLEQGIRLEDIDYAYPNGTQALKGVNIEIGAGKTVALVGASGSGKSTVALLLLRFRQPARGRILVDGEDYWQFNAASWHRAVGVVEQEAFLFHDTMEKNISYGFEEATPEAINRAVAMAHLEDVVEGLPDGLKTTVGERGTMLSGGQRQRLAIARALVRNPLMLILDEATSALDTVSERQVQAALEGARKGRTVLIIAHRLSTIRHADLIAVMEGGRVVEQGTWEELSAARGAFRRLLDSSEHAGAIVA